MQKVEKSSSEKKLPKTKKTVQKKSELSLEKLELRLAKLSHLALHHDPYGSEPQDQTLLNLIQEFELQDHLHNPFHFTNQLLALIDQTENQLKSSKQ